MEPYFVRHETPDQRGFTCYMRVCFKEQPPSPTPLCTTWRVHGSFKKKQTKGKHVCEEISVMRPYECRSLLSHIFRNQILLLYLSPSEVTKELYYATATMFCSIQRYPFSRSGITPYNVVWQNRAKREDRQTYSVTPHLNMSLQPWSSPHRAQALSIRPSKYRTKNDSFIYHPEWTNEWFVQCHNLLPTVRENCIIADPPTYWQCGMHCPLFIHERGQRVT